MLNKFYTWVGKHALGIFMFVILVSALLAIYHLVDVVRKPAPITVVEGSIQHHLVWSTKGECFFVRPHSNETVYLIRVQDCDKK